MGTLININTENNYYYMKIAKLRILNLVLGIIMSLSMVNCNDESYAAQNIEVQNSVFGQWVVSISIGTPP